jgi:hypothetical protein
MIPDEILDKYAIGVSAGEYTIECDKAHTAMEEYAKQKGEAFLKWVADNHYCPNSSNLWFDYTLSRDDVRFYTIAQLYDWYHTGIKFTLPPIEPPKSLQKTAP